MFTRNEIVLKYAEGPSRLEAAIDGMSATDLDHALSADSWTIRQIVHHVADGDDIWTMFVKQAIGNPGSEFMLEWYWQILQDEWAERWAYETRAVEPSLALFRANRRHTVQLLENAPDAWEKCLRIRWPERGEQNISVKWVVEMQTGHLQGHLDDIRRIREVRCI